MGRPGQISTAQNCNFSSSSTCAADVYSDHSGGQYSSDDSAFAAADTDGDGVISAVELAAYTEKVQEHAQQQHAQFVSALEQQQAVEQQLRDQLKLARQQGYEVKEVPAATPVNQVPAKSKSSFCVVQ